MGCVLILLYHEDYLLSGFELNGVLLLLLPSGGKTGTDGRARMADGNTMAELS